MMCMIDSIILVVSCLRLYTLICHCDLYVYLYIALSVSTSHVYSLSHVYGFLWSDHQNAFRSMARLCWIVSNNYSETAKNENLHKHPLKILHHITHAPSSNLPLYTW